MSLYRDADGREWEMRVTCGSLERCRTDAGYDPLRLANEGELHRIHLDPTLLASIAWCSVAEEATRRGVTRAQFIDGVRGDAIERLADAWVDAFSDFFPARKAGWIRQTNARIEAAMAAQMSPSESGDASTSLPESSGSILAI